MTINLTPEEARNGCKAGQGDKCCAYLAIKDGFICGREEDWLKIAIDARLEAGTLNAKRTPTSAYPECQNDE